MILETLLMTAAIAAGLHVARNHHQVIRGVWAQARWYERVALCLALLPIPGPVDELLGVLVIRRVLARGRRSA